MSASVPRITVAWQLGHHLAHENDRKADLLKRLVLHGLTTNQYIVFHGDSDTTVHPSNGEHVIANAGSPSVPDSRSSPRRCRTASSSVSRRTGRSLKKICSCRFFVPVEMRTRSRLRIAGTR